MPDETPIDQSPQDQSPLVLVVEDNAVNSELTCKILSRKLGIDPIVKEDGEAALAWCQTQRPDLILMDISLPGMDGLEVTRRLREREEYADVPILALTAHALGGWQEKTAEAGCTAYLSKPVRPRDLIEAVSTYLPH